MMNAECGMLNGVVELLRFRIPHSQFRILFSAFRIHHSALLP